MRLVLAGALLTACATTGTPRPQGVVAETDEAQTSRTALVVPARPMPTPLDGLATDLRDAFGGYNLLYYIGAVGATGAIAASGADHRIHVAAARNNENRSWDKSASIAGYVLPTVTPTALWVTGLATHDREVAGAGAAAIQAVVVAMATTGALKLVTGRPRPIVDETMSDQDRPTTFEPFQRISGWPSGHATGAFSLTAALTAYAPEKHWIPAIGYPIAVAIGTGMIDIDGHWTSDVVAGALIGQAIGWSVGRNFRKRVRGDPESVVQLAPFPGGLGVSGSW